MTHRIDVLSVGDIVSDSFIRLLPAEAEIDKDAKDKHPLLCMTYGSKIPFEYAVTVHGVGNSPNAAVSFARLGLKSSLYSNMGQDDIGQKMLESLKSNRVQTQYIDVHKGKASNFHFVLWYDADRTILIKHETYSYAWPHIPVEDTPKWIYLSSLGEAGWGVHAKIVEYLKKHPDVKLAFQPGTFQMRKGFAELRDLMRHTELFVVNKEEAQMMTSKNTDDIAELAHAIHKEGARIVAITDGPKGSYASDGTTVWQMRNYPDPKPPFERTGAGDAYTSTFVAGLIYSDGDVKTAMQWGPINSMSVVQDVGAQAGLLSKAKLEAFLKDAPKDYEPKEYRN